MVERLSNFIGVAETEDVLVKAFIEVVENGVGRSQFERQVGDEN